MSRSKIVVKVGALPGNRTRALRVNVTAGTTCAQVLRKTLEKCHVTEPPFKYQLWAVGRAPGQGKWAELTVRYLYTHYTTDLLYTYHMPYTVSPYPQSPSEQVLRDEERPAAVLAQWRRQGEEPHFNLRLRSSGIIRVHHSLEAGLQSFQSLIVTPTMTTHDILQIAIAKLRPHDNPSDFELLERTPHGGEVMP